ncbi:MAG: hypothetical protein HYX68_12635 [Planctomycetes bacterium]|nr:hypothetical protein [Planctomycetota bacterium]
MLSNVQTAMRRWHVIRAPGFLCAGLLFCLLAPIAVHGQPRIVLDPPRNGKLDAIVPVMAQGSLCAAVSDVHSVLAFGHDKTHPDAHLSLFKLDAKGIPAASATHVKLPCPKGLAKFSNFVTGLAFHPKLPLLYVWNDVTVPYPSPPPPPDVKLFDHLCIFNIAKDPPELLVSLCRGDEYLYGQYGGAVAIDATGSYLYIPNVRDVKNAGFLRLGRFPLDADGLPALVDSKEAVPARTQKLIALNAAGKFAPTGVTPIEYVHLFPSNAFGVGHSLTPIGKDAVIASASQGLMTWRPDDKHATLHGLPLKIGGHTRFCVHPTLPAIFATVTNGVRSDGFFHAEQTDGYLTSLPRQYVIADSKLSGPPAVLTKRKKLAIGGEYLVYVMDLDEVGLPTGVPTRMLVNNPFVKALVYSERFDRAYVGVEVSK